MTTDIIECGDQLAVRASSRAAAQRRIADEHGVTFGEIKLQRRFMRPCRCEGCMGEDDPDVSGPLMVHGYDEFWVFCDASDDDAVEWWIEV